MRIGLIQLNAKTGDFENNRLAIQKLAESVEAELYVCPELSLSGYHARDLFTRKEFIQEDQRQLQLLCEWSKRTQKSIWVGHTLNLREGSDQTLYNAASLVINGQVVRQSLKRQLPNYNIFEEKRYFAASNQASENTSFAGFEMAAEICEDSWTKVQKFGLDEWLHYAPGGATTFSSSTDPKLLINLSASPFVSGKPEIRRRLLQNLARRRGAYVVYANFSGAQDEIVFDGQSAVYSPGGECLLEAPAFTEGVFVVDTKHTKAILNSPPRETWADIHQAICTFIRDYARKSGFKKVVLGLSGGIDSALCAALCADALGAENVLGVGLATQWTSDLSKHEAKLLADNLGLEYQDLEIEAGLQTLTGLVGEKLKPLSQENIQSRLRGLLLMTLSNNQDRLLISTSNKSEIAMGYSTLYGDMCGALMPIGDLYKCEVYGLAHFINQQAGKLRIPLLTLVRAPSAELSANQKDSDALPDYAKLDAFLYTYLEHRDRLFDERDRWNKFLLPFSTEGLVRKIQLNEFKRIQTPLICKIHHRSFGQHWNMPVAKAIDLPGPTS